MKYAKDIMTSEVGTVNEKTLLVLAETFREALNVRHVPVIDDDSKVIGIFSMRDLVTYLLSSDSQEAVVVNDIMSSPVITAGKDTPLKELASTMRKHNISAMPIVSDYGVLIGIVTERDFLKLV